jgi:hypothetical protein
VALIGLLVLGFAVSNIQQAAWAQGYATGLMAGSGDGDTLAQYVLYNSGLPGRAGSGFGGIFALGLLFFGFLAVARVGRMWMWRYSGGPGGGPDGEPWRRWQCGRQESPEEAAAEATPASAKHGNTPASGAESKT